MQNKKTILAQIYRHTSNSIMKLVSENLCTTISARMSLKTSTNYLINMTDQLRKCTLPVNSVKKVVFIQRHHRCCM